MQKITSKILATIGALGIFMTIGTSTFTSVHADQNLQYVYTSNDLKEIGYQQGKETTSLKPLNEKFIRLIQQTQKSYNVNGHAIVPRRKLAKMTKDMPFIPDDFKAKASDMNYYVNAYHLSNHDIHVINSFIARLVNNARKILIKRGLVGKVHPSMQAYKFAQQVNKEYARDHWNAIDKGHDVKGINRVARKWGLAYDTTAQSQYYEDTASDSALTHKLYSHISMAALKAAIYGNLYELVWKDNEHSDCDWGHTISLLGLYDRISGFSHLGISVTVDWNGTMHFTTIPRKG